MFLIILAAALYGLAFGSFANALAYRFPTGESLMTRSHCTKCDMMITWWMNIPVLSWLFLGGKCFKCKDKISFQYPLIELLTTVMFVLVSLKVSTLGLGLISGLLTAAALCFVVFIGVVLSIIDAKTMLLPTKLIMIGLIGAVPLLVASAAIEQDYVRLLTMLIGSVGSFVFYFLIWFFFPQGIGYGDVRLSVLTGAVLGWFSVGHAIAGLMIPFITFSFALLPLMILKLVDRKTKAPLGPWIIGGMVLTILLGDILISLFVSIGGF